MSVTLLSTRRNLKRSRGSGSKSNVVDVPLPKRRNVSAITSDPPLSGKNFWLIKSESGKTAFYLSMNNDGELQALTGTPNRDFAPNIFGLQRGSQAGRCIIYVYAMIPNNKSNDLYALTIVKDLDGQWRLKYRLYNRLNSHNYEWSFSCHNNAFAIRWCGNTSNSGRNFMLCLDSDGLKVKLTSHAPDQALLPDHEYFISTFHPI